MPKLLHFFLRTALLVSLGLSASVHATTVRVLTVQGAISPASADYLLRGLAKTIEDQAWGTLNQKNALYLRSCPSGYCL